MKFLRMETEHVAQVAALEQECFSAPWSENAISSELQNPLSTWFVAMCDGVFAGYVGSQAVMGEADMMNLAVKPDYRRQGVAEGLVNALVASLKEQEVHSLTLEVRMSNEAAIALYNKLGFAQVGRRPGYYTKPKEDALILRKEWQV